MRWKNILIKKIYNDTSVACADRDTCVACAERDTCVACRSVLRVCGA